MWSRICPSASLSRAYESNATLVGRPHKAPNVFNTFLAIAPIDENFAGIEVDVADLAVDELAHAYSRIEVAV